jgi:hypothetical protein
MASPSHSPHCGQNTSIFLKRTELARKLLDDPRPLTDVKITQLIMELTQFNVHQQHTYLECGKHNVICAISRPAPIYACLNEILHGRAGRASHFGATIRHSPGARGEAIRPLAGRSGQTIDKRTNFASKRIFTIACW